MANELNTTQTVVNQEMSIGDFLSQNQIDENQNDIVSLNTFMGETPKSTTIEPVEEEDKMGFLQRVGENIYIGMSEFANNFNKLIRLDRIPFYKRQIEDREYEIAIMKGEVDSHKRGVQVANSVLQGFGSMALSLPIDVMAGGMTKTALAGKVLPKVAAVLGEIPDFALGSAWRGLIQGINDSPDFFQAVPRGILSALENASWNTLFGKAGTGISGISKMATLGVANSAYSASKQGRFPTQDEMISGGSEGLAYGIIFTVAPALAQATKIPMEKKVLNEYNKEMSDGLAKSDYGRVGETIGKIMTDNRIRPKIKEAINSVLKGDLSESLYQKIFNRFQSIENIVKKAKEMGWEVPVGIDAGVSAARYLSIANQAENVIKNGTFKIKPDGNIEVTGEGLKHIIDYYDKNSIEKNPLVREKDLNDFLIATRTIEDLQRLPYEGAKRLIVTTKQIEKAQDRLTEIQKKYQENMVVMKDAAKRLYDYQSRVFHLLVDSGILSEEQYRKILRVNQHYIPFDRIFPEETEVQSVSPVSRNRFNIKSTGIKKIKGSERDIHNPIESIIKNTYKIMDKASRNEVFRNVFVLRGVPELGMKEIKAPIVPVAKTEHRATIDLEFHQKIIDFAKSLGAKFKQEGKIGARYLGMFKGATKEIIRKFGTAREVISHEVGHFFDTRFNLGSRFFDKTKPNYEKLQIEMVKLMQRIGESKKRMANPRERFADAFEWWLTHRDLAKRDLPEFHKEMMKTINDIPELKPILKIEPTPRLNVERMIETIFRPSKFKPAGENIIEGFFYGKRKYLQVSKNLYEAMTGLDEVSSNLFVRIMSQPTQWLRVGATTTPEFMVRNLMRDQWTAFLQTRIGFNPFFDSTASIADIMNRSEIYNDWIRSGGSYAGFVELSRPRLKMMLNELKGNKSLMANLNIVTKLQDASQLLEQATRLGVYKAAIKKGLSPVEAAKESREATVDFSRRGSMMRDINRTVAFFNAGLQAFDKNIRTTIKDPVGLLAKGVATITVPSLLLYLKNRQDPDYKELPRWQKDLFWMYSVDLPKFGKTWIRIPKPFTYGQIFGSLPERFFEYLDTKDPDAFNEYGKTFYEALSPVAGDPIVGIVPNALRPVLENSFNYNFFLERPIVPEYQKKYIPEEQFSKYDTETSKALGKILNVSPSKIENLVRGYYGGLGRYGLQTVDVGIDAIRRMQGKDVAAKQPIDLADIPLLRGFVSRDVEVSSQSIKDFYKNKTQLESYYLTYNKYKREGKKEEADAFKKEHSELSLYNKFVQYGQELSELNKKSEKIVANKNLSDDDKRKAINDIGRKKIERAKAANEALKKLLKKK